MATLEELIVKLEGDNAKLLSALEESSKVTARTSKDMQDAITRFSDQASKSTNKFSDVMTVFAGTTMANIVTKAASLAASALGSLVDHIKEGIRESAEFELALVNLANSLEMNGNFSKKAITDLEEWIGKMEELTGIDDAVIAGNLAMLSSFTKLDAQGLKRAEAAALDFAAIAKVDLNTAVKLIAKSAEGSTDAFKKYNVHIEEASTKSQTLENTLTTLEKRFGGSAAAQMKTFSGSVLGLSNSFGNLFQAIGDVIVRNPAIIAAINSVTKLISGMTTSVSKSADVWRKELADGLSSALIMFTAITRNVETLINEFTAGVKVIVLGVQTIVNSFLIAGNAAEILIQKFNGLFTDTKDIVKAKSEAIDKEMNRIFESTESLMKTLDNDTPVTNIIDQVAEATKKAADAMSYAFNGVKDDTVKLTEVEQMRLNMAKEFGRSLVESSIDVVSAYQIQQDALTSSYENQFLTFETYKEAILTSQQGLFDQQLAMLQQSNLDKEQLELASMQLSLQQTAARGKMLDDLKKKEEDTNKQKLAGYSSFFGNLATLQKTGSRELFEIGKAAAIAQATIDGYAAVQGAYKQGSIIGGPPLGAAFAAAAAIATATNLAKISATALQSGIDSVPGVGSRDNFPAMLAPGERVVPAETNQDLTEFLKNQSERPTTTNVFNINFSGPVLGNKAELGAEIIEYINEATARGMGLRLLES